MLSQYNYIKTLYLHVVYFPTLFGHSMSGCRAVINAKNCDFIIQKQNFPYMNWMQSLFAGTEQLLSLVQKYAALMFVIQQIKTSINRYFVQVLPVSLAQIFLLHFNLRFPTLRSFEKVAPILSVCLAALYPLTLLEIYYSINSLNTNHFLQWDEFLQRFKVSKSLSSSVL